MRRRIASRGCVRPSVRPSLTPSLRRLLAESCAVYPALYSHLLSLSDPHLACYPSSPPRLFVLVFFFVFLPFMFFFTILPMFTLGYLVSHPEYHQVYIAASGATEYEFFLTVHYGKQVDLLPCLSCSPFFFFLCACFSVFPSVSLVLTHTLCLSVSHYPSLFLSPVFLCLFTERLPSGIKCEIT